MKQKKSLIAIISILLALGVTACGGSSQGGGESSGGGEQQGGGESSGGGEQQDTGDLVASKYSQSEDYFVNDNISISFAGKFTNTTGKAITYSSNVGQITNKGLWTYTPTQPGEFDIKITGVAGGKTASVEFKLTIKDVGRISSKSFVQTNIYRPNDVISVNVADCFNKDGTVGELSYSSTVGTIDSKTGDWTYTPTKAGVVSDIITATSGNQSATLKLDICVTGSFYADADQQIVLNTDDKAIGEYIVKANEEVVIDGRSGKYASTDLVVPSHDSNPVLYFYYSGEKSSCPTIYAYKKGTSDLLAVLYNGCVVTGGKGQGMGVTTSDPTKSIPYQTYAFDLNEYFKLDEATEVEFRFSDGDGVTQAAKTGSIVRFAGVNLTSKNALTSVEGPFGTTYALYNNDDNTISKTADGFVRLDVKGDSNPSDDTVFSAVYFGKGVGTMKDYKFYIKGNAEYRIYQYAVDGGIASNGNLSEESLKTFSYGRPNGYSTDSGWSKAKENGQIVYYNGATSIAQAAVAVVVAVRASTADSYVEFASSAVSDGVFAAVDSVSYGAVVEPFTDVQFDFSTYFLNNASGLYTLIYSLGEGSVGTIDAATGLWSHNFAVGGTYTFDIIATVGNKSDKIQFTVEAKSGLVVDEFSLDSYDKDIGDTVQANFGAITHNSTGFDCVYTANVGTIDPVTGEWSYNCDTSGDVEVFIGVTAGTYSKNITFTLHVVGGISVTEYLNKNLYHVGESIELDLSSHFSSSQALTYSSNIGAIDSNGVFTFVPTCGGYFNVVITASTGTEEAKLPFTLTVAGTITEQTSKKATISTEPQTIAGIEALAGEAAVVNRSGIVETVLNVPASNKTQVLSFAYTANAGAKILIEVRDLDNTFKYCLFNGNNTATGTSGHGGMGNTSDGAYAVTPGQIITFELNPYFTLAEDTQLKFVFKNVASSSAAGATMGVSSITVGPQSNFNKYQTTEYGDWYSINENADNTVSVTDNTVRVDVKGVNNPSSDSVIALYQTYVIPSDSTLKNNGIKLWIEGNADYRILMIDSLPANSNKEGTQSDKPNRVTQSVPYLYPNKTALTDPDLLGWNKATTEGALNWYGGSSLIAGHQIVVIVMVKASTANTYIEFCDGALHA